MGKDNVLGKNCNLVTILKNNLFHMYEQLLIICIGPLRRWFNYNEKWFIYFKQSTLTHCNHNLHLQIVLLI